MIERLIRSTISPKWTFSKSGQAAIQLQNGLGLLPGLFNVAAMDDERIVDYIAYQVYRNREVIADGRWQLSWLFSKNALDKYRKQFLSESGKSGMNYYINQWLDEFELSRGALVAMIAKPKPNPLRRMIYMESEEPIKKRFLNTEAGLMLCQQATTGWSPLSATCKECKSWVECGKITAKKYPELMRFRKEAYGKEK